MREKSNAIHYRHNTLLLLEWHERGDKVQMRSRDFSWRSRQFFHPFSSPQNREILQADGFRRKQRKYTRKFRRQQKCRQNDDINNVMRFQLKANYKTSVK